MNTKRKKKRKRTEPESPLADVCLPSHAIKIFLINLSEWALVKEHCVCCQIIVIFRIWTMAGRNFQKQFKQRWRCEIEETKETKTIKNLQLRTQLWFKGRSQWIRYHLMHVFTYTKTFQQKIQNTWCSIWYKYHCYRPTLSMASSKQVSTKMALVQWPSDNVKQPWRITSMALRCVCCTEKQNATQRSSLGDSDILQKIRSLQLWRDDYWLLWRTKYL